MSVPLRLLYLSLAVLLLAPLRSPAQQHVPEEYTDEEFSAALRDLRRGETILLGSLPFTLFFTMEVYDVGRYFAHGRQPEYSPWPLRKPGSAPYTAGESLGVLASAIGVSLLVAVADYLIGRAHARREPRRPAAD